MGKLMQIQNIIHEHQTKMAGDGHINSEECLQNNVTFEHNIYVMHGPWFQIGRRKPENTLDEDLSWIMIRTLYLSRNLDKDILMFRLIR